MTASRDGTTRIWDAASLSVRAVLADPGGAVYAARFDGRGRQIATGSADGVVRIWTAPHDFGLDDLSFIRATASLGLDSALLAKYALPPLPRSAGRPKEPPCTAGAADAAAFAEAARNGQAACHRSLAELYEAGQPGAADLGRALFHHAVAARLFEEQGFEAAAQQERYRREALAWLLPRPQAGHLMDGADDWTQGQAFPP